MPRPERRVRPRARSSASMRSGRRPSFAAANAMFRAVTLLPSPGAVDVMMTVFPPTWSRAKLSDGHGEVVGLGCTRFGIRVGGIRPVRTDIRILGNDREERCVEDGSRRVAVVGPLVLLGSPPCPRSGGDDAEHHGDRRVAHGPWLYLGCRDRRGPRRAVRPEP